MELQRMERFSHDDFESGDLLKAVDNLDNMRYVLADKDDIIPPESRQNLMKLHRMVFNALNYKGDHDKEKMIELIDEIRDDVDQVKQNAIYIVDKLVELESALYRTTLNEEHEK